MLVLELRVLLDELLFDATIASQSLYEAGEAALESIDTPLPCLFGWRLGVGNQGLEASNVNPMASIIRLSD